MRDSLYSLVGFVESRRLEGFPDVCGSILGWYCGVSMMTVA
jgi:hypothetical protein